MKFAVIAAIVGSAAAVQLGQYMHPWAQQWEYEWRIEQQRAREAEMRARMQERLTQLQNDQRMRYNYI